MSTVSSAPAVQRPLALVAVALTAFAVGCASRPEVRLDQDPHVDLRSYRTFGFYESAATERAGYTSLLNSRLQQATRVQLEKQHYVYSESNPDLRVNVLVQVADRVELRSTPPSRGFYGYRGWGSGVESVAYRQGTLRIDLVDSQRRALVWQGVAEGRLDSEAIRNPGPSADAAVGEIFARFADGKTP